MQVLGPAVILAAALAWLPSADLRAEGEVPTYLVLPRSRTVGYPLPTDRARYAYGWFGVKPPLLRQWTRHFGFYGNYTQLKQR